MEIAFRKMHGAANDFIMIDDRALTFPANDRDWIASIATRRTGIGSDGVLLLQPAESNAHFKMRFFNPDGGEAEMCGNAARCACRLAYDLGIAPEHMQLETGAGPMEADIVDNQVLLYMTPPFDWRMNQELDLNGQAIPYHFVNSGVPHVVHIVEDLQNTDVMNLGAGFRYHDAFAPAGTNANFIQITGPDSILVRTYERGVENETLACGTGMVACALIAGKISHVQPPVKLTCASGDTLQVNYSLTDEGAENVTLLGPAVYVFDGTLNYA